MFFPKRLCLTTGLLLICAISNARSDASPNDHPPAKSQNVTINLINRLVERGVLTKEDAADLIQQAESDAAEARAQAEAVAAMQTANPPPLTAPAAVTTAPEPPSEYEDTVRVTYIPESVKSQLREEIKSEVMDQAREERWAAPRSFPEWVSRFQFFADLRMRYEGDFFPSGNDNAGAFPNFNAINTSAPFDVTGTTFSPQLNVDRERERFRLRFRFGVAADLGDNFTAGFRIATGENNSPTSTNQSLGGANNAQGGDFSKYAIWLDRAFVKYELGATPENDFAVWLGRFDNPWFATDLIWDDDLGFDGIALQAREEVAQGVTPFVTIGGFPVFNTDLNFASNRPDKFSSEDKYLLAGQLGTTWQIRKDLSIKIAAAYYDFENIQGRLSSPFVPLTASDAGDTDDSRPAFAQKGNTYFPIRDILPTADNSFGTTKQFQYYGLVTPFRDVAVTGQLNWDHYDPFHVALTGEWITNTAFDRAYIDRIAVNNRGPDVNGQPGRYVGGNSAWLVNLKLGRAALEKRWDWNVGVNYRYIESDAVVDGFNDSDFGLGGTNLKGYEIYGNVALSPRVFLGLRWLSANEVSGPKFSSDIIQFDFNARF